MSSLLTRTTSSLARAASSRDATGRRGVTRAALIASAPATLGLSIGRRARQRRAGRRRPGHADRGRSAGLRLLEQPVADRAAHDRHRTGRRSMRAAFIRERLAVAAAYREPARHRCHRLAAGQRRSRSAAGDDRRSLRGPSGAYFVVQTLSQGADRRLGAAGGRARRVVPASRDSRAQRSEGSSARRARAAGRGAAR